jgi:hypothetical protein
MLILEAIIAKKAFVQMFSRYVGKKVLSYEAVYGNNLKLEFESGFVVGGKYGSTISSENMLILNTEDELVLISQVPDRASRSNRIKECLQEVMEEESTTLSKLKKRFLKNEREALTIAFDDAQLSEDWHYDC